MHNDHPETAVNGEPRASSLPPSISSHTFHDTGHPAPPPLPPARKEKHAFVFTGSGSEYFRIWIVNLCLTIATLGIYSAWAKVRRLQYFDRNTQLAGATFNFHGDPKAILKGRIVALVLLAAYHYAFGFSKIFGIVVISFLLLALPWMMRSALRFRLRNTSYRALRFNFGGSLGGAYATYLPILVLFLLPGVAAAVAPMQARWIGGASLLYLAWPVMHGFIKRYQHANLQFGASSATYTASVFRFIGPYFLAFLLAVLSTIVAGIFIAIAMGGIGIFGRLKSHGLAGADIWLAASFMLSIVITAYVFYLATGPYLQVRIYNLVWSHTRFPQVEITSELRAWPYIRLQAVNLLLTLLTLGLYRPFAVVRIYRYRLDHMSVVTEGDFEQLASGEQQLEVGASGDGAVDFLGFDLSW
ncbi:YjgN family protein [Undibacterium terreum]|uniref:Membrane protein n=1 Tax=Undibacterium terreum TaxID=1224302 RepID=A0A916UCT8_9BURK|nr:YjgN family protein [Undibacterium terreum]GGC67533.1 membrane protein [Undibacterium terreum]